PQYPTLLEERTNVPKDGEVIRQPAAVAAFVEPELASGAGARQSHALLVRDELIALTVQYEDGPCNFRHGSHVVEGIAHEKRRHPVTRRKGAESGEGGLQDHGSKRPPFGQRGNRASPQRLPVADDAARVDGRSRDENV